MNTWATDRPVWWEVTTLRKCATWYSGGTPSTSVEAYWNGDVPWITASSLHDFYIRDSERKVTQLGLQNGTRLMPSDTIIFVVRGMSLKTEFRLGIARRPVAFGQDCKAIVAKKGIEPLFLANALRAKAADVMRMVDEASHGTGRLQTDVLQNLEIRLPPLATQRRIAEILGRLDDKIEVNRRINRTLERMAQALYKHWFVDFGPFQGGEFAESELGLVPKGWEVKRLKDVCNLTMGQSPKSEFYNDEGDGLPFHQGVTDFGERFPRHRRHCVISPRIALAGDILLSVRAPVGRINLADTKLVIGRGLAAINHRRGYQSLAFYQMKHLFAEEDSMGSGTIFRAVSKGDLESLRLIVPPDEIAREFDQRVSVWEAQIASNSVQTESLTATRDYLLPRLLAGEVEV